MEEDDKGGGCFYWDCPRCNEGALHTYPYRPDDKERWMCWNCSRPGKKNKFFFMGDADDAIRWLHGDRHVREDYGRRQVLHDALLAQYDRDYRDNQPIRESKSALSLAADRPGGVRRGGGKRVVTLPGGAVLYLTDAEIQAVVLADELCESVNQPFHAVAQACRRL
jgi:hypothetical protein